MLTSEQLRTNFEPYRDEVLQLEACLPKDRMLQPGEHPQLLDTGSELAVFRLQSDPALVAKIVGYNSGAVESADERPIVVARNVINLSAGSSIPRLEQIHASSLRRPSAVLSHYVPGPTFLNIDKNKLWHTVSDDNLREMLHIFIEMEHNGLIPDPGFGNIKIPPGIGVTVLDYEILDDEKYTDTTSLYFTVQRIAEDLVNEKPYSHIRREIPLRFREIATEVLGPLARTAINNSWQRNTYKFDP